MLSSYVYFNKIEIKKKESYHISTSAEADIKYKSPLVEGYYKKEDDDNPTKEKAHYEFEQGGIYDRKDPIMNPTDIVLDNDRRIPFESDVLHVTYKQDSNFFTNKIGIKTAICAALVFCFSLFYLKSVFKTIFFTLLVFALTLCFGQAYYQCNEYCKRKVYIEDVLIRKAAPGIAAYQPCDTYESLYNECIDLKVSHMHIFQYIRDNNEREAVERTGHFMGHDLSSAIQNPGLIYNFLPVTDRTLNGIDPLHDETFRVHRVLNSEFRESANLGKTLLKKINELQNICVDKQNQMKEETYDQYLISLLSDENFCKLYRSVMIATLAFNSLLADQIETIRDIGPFSGQGQDISDRMLNEDVLKNIRASRGILAEVIMNLHKKIFQNKFKWNDGKILLSKKLIDILGTYNMLHFASSIDTS